MRRNRRLTCGFSWWSLGTRTPNPLLAKQVRYQLRQGPVVGPRAGQAVEMVGQALSTLSVASAQSVTEGVPPAMIENAGKQAGMPVGPLSLNR